MHTHSPLDRAVGRCLDNLDSLTEKYATDVRGLPGYLPTVVTEEELQGTARETLDLLLRMLREEDVRPRLDGLSSGIGKRRARQGLALDSLLRAVRMDFRFLWEALQDHLEGEDPAGLTGDVVKVWEVVEVHTSRVQAAYLDELSHMRRAVELEHGYLLRKLLVAGVPDAKQLGQIASVLSVPVHGRFILAVANASYSREFREAVEELGWSVPVYSVDGFEVAIIEEGKVGVHGKNQLMGLPAGVAPPVTGLGGLASVWELAQRLAGCVASPSTAAELGEHWEDIVGRDVAAGLAVFRNETLSGFGHLTPTARQLTISTVQEYFRTGSVSVTAATLYCHRNTILKRLRLFTECTGLVQRVPTTPAQYGWFSAETGPGQARPDPGSVRSLRRREVRNSPRACAFRHRSVPDPLRERRPQDGAVWWHR